MSIFRTIAAPLVALGIALTLGCVAVEPKTTATTKEAEKTSVTQRDLVGTWRAEYVKVGELGEMQGKTLPWPNPFFMRFYEDGTVATWSPFRTVPRARFEVKDGQLYLPDIRSQGSPLGVMKDRMWYSGAEGDTLFFQRVSPNLEPGQMQ